MENDPIVPEVVPIGYAPAGPGGQGMATASLTLGILGLFMWFCPIVGFVIGIVGLVLGIQSNKQFRRRSATAGMVMSIICLLLSVGNGAWGAYMGATGQHPVSNWINQQGGSGT